jgi:hypothetical protein
MIFLLSAAAAGWAQQVEVTRVGNLIPAGALMSCTLDEPNFSSQTARPGDPILCKTSSVEMFGHSVIPRGAYLSARLRNYRDPGHFFGKGWLQLEFTTLILPGGSVPIDAKVITAARYRVNGEGKIQGSGHAKRDAVEWAIPILWPVKVLTLPVRGPRPALKGETRIELRLMEDLLIPDSAYSGAGGLTLRTSLPQRKPDDAGAGVAATQFANFFSDSRVAPQQPLSITRAANRGPLSGTQPLPAILVLRDGRMYGVSDYWTDRGNLDYTTNGVTYAVPLNTLDIAMTRQLNAERGIMFAPASRNR